jgi:hypothetical protein
VIVADLLGIDLHAAVKLRNVRLFQYPVEAIPGSVAADHNPFAHSPSPPLPFLAETFDESGPRYGTENVPILLFAVLKVNKIHPGFRFSMFRRDLKRTTLSLLRT